VGDETRHASPLDIVKTLIIYGSAVGLLVGGATWTYQMTQLIATKTYHEADQEVMAEQIQEAMTMAIEPVKESAYNSETEAIITRILRLHGMKCDGSTDEWDSTIRQQKRRFKKLTGNAFKGADGCN